jgi:hypothetical protein
MLRYDGGRFFPNFAHLLAGSVLAMMETTPGLTFSKI